MRGTLEERFWAKVDRQAPGGCWLWLGARTKSDGYGRFYPESNRGVLAHRFSFQLAGGVIPSDMQMDHLCRVKLCVNPAHLEVVTGSENKRRGYAANPYRFGRNQQPGAPREPREQRTHCPEGHRLPPSKFCNACRREYKRQWQREREQDPQWRDARKARERKRYRARRIEDPEWAERKRVANRNAYAKRKGLSIGG